TLADRMPVFRELLDRTVVDHEDGPPQLCPEFGESHAAGCCLLSATQQLFVPVVEIARKEIAAVVQEQVRLGRQYPAKIFVMLALVGSPVADDVDAMGPEIADRFGLGAVEISG